MFSACSYIWTLKYFGKNADKNVIFACFKHIDFITNIKNLLCGDDSIMCLFSVYIDKGKEEWTEDCIFGKKQKGIDIFTPFAIPRNIVRFSIITNYILWPRVIASLHQRFVCNVYIVLLKIIWHITQTTQKCSMSLQKVHVHSTPMLCIKCKKKFHVHSTSEGGRIMCFVLPYTLMHVLTRGYQVGRRNNEETHTTLLETW